MSFYLAICVELFETYRILHRVGGLFVVLRFQILVYGYWAFLYFGEAFLRSVSVFLSEKLPHARQSMVVTIRPGL